MLKRFFAPLAIVLAFAAYLVPAAANAAKDGFSHHVVFHLDENDAGKMNLVLNNAKAVTNYYKKAGENVKIEIVTYGPGLNMLREHKSPIKDRVISFAGSFDNVTFAACGNTIKKVTKKEGAAPHIFEFAKVVPSGVVQLMKRQDQGWHYIRP